MRTRRVVPLVVFAISILPFAALAQRQPGPGIVRVGANPPRVMSKGRPESASLRTQTTTAADLVPYQPTDSSDKIVVSTAGGTNTDSSTLTPTDALFVDWAVFNNGNDSASADSLVSLYVDGVFRQSWPLSIDLPPDFYIAVDDVFIGTLPAGMHSVKIVADSNNVVNELDESNNEYTKAIVVTAGALRGDSNGDHNADIYWRSYATGANAVWTMNGTSFGTIVNLPALPNPAYRIEGVGDFNADGTPDVLWRNGSTGADALWLMNGASVSTIVNLPGLPGANFHFEGVADMDLDGKPDILIRNYLNGNNAVWIMDGTVFTSIVNLLALPNPDYHIEAAADFSGDGKPDILWRNYTTGANALWLMNGTTYTGTVNLPPLPNSSYHIEGAADYDKDGHNDIVWRSYATGADALWLMDASYHVSVVNIPALPDTNYELSGPR